MKTASRVHIVKEIQALKRRLRLVERQAAVFQKPKALSLRRAFRQKYPHVHVDPQLFRLVGIDPPLSLEEEKREIGEAVTARYETK